MYFDDGLTVKQLNATSGTLIITKQFLTTNQTNIKNIIQFTKSIINPSFDDLDIDIKLTGKNDSKTTIYVVVFGVNKHVDYISDKLWDRLYYFEADHLKLEVPIDMNNQNIINVADGVDDNDVVTRKQLNKYPNPNWYYYTDNLKHDKTQVFALNQMNKYPFIVDSHSNYMKIIKSGFYQLTYHDYYIFGGTLVIYDETNNKDLHRIGVFNTNIYKFISLNAVFQIELTDSVDHNEISIFIETTNGGKLRGKGYSSFYIKYLHD